MSAAAYTSAGQHGADARVLPCQYLSVNALQLYTDVRSSTQAMKRHNESK
jgi:hypothetical protein